MKRLWNAYSWSVVIASVPIGFVNGFNYKGEKNVKGLSLLLVRTWVEATVFPYTAYRYIKYLSE